MTKQTEALKLALEALEQLQGGCTDHNDGTVEAITVWCPEVITAIREALALVNKVDQEQPAQPQQEPVAWSYWQSCLNDDGTQTAPWVHRLSKFQPSESVINKDITPLYTAPPAQRTWVGLTDDEIDQGLLRSDYALKTAEAWRAGVVFAMTKLKEKNT